MKYSFWFLKYHIIFSWLVPFEHFDKIIQIECHVCSVFVHGVRCHSLNALCPSFCTNKQKCFCGWGGRLWKQFSGQWKTNRRCGQVVAARTTQCRGKKSLAFIKHQEMIAALQKMKVSSENDRTQWMIKEVTFYQNVKDKSIVFSVLCFPPPIKL